MKVTKAYYNKTYRNADLIIPFIDKVKEGIKKANAEHDLFVVNMYKRLQSIVQKNYSYMSTSVKRMNVDEEWLKDPKAFIIYIMDLAYRCEYEPEHWPYYRITRFDKNGDFCKGNITIKLTKDFPGGK